MIVECDRCSTQFQLDESKVPARGIRVRCSSCKYSFLLRRPDASRVTVAQVDTPNLGRIQVTRMM